MSKIEITNEDNMVGILYAVSMGCRSDSPLKSHRARYCFKNIEGNKYLLEISMRFDGIGTITHCVDESQVEINQIKLQKLNNEFKEKSKTIRGKEFWEIRDKYYNKKKPLMSACDPCMPVSGLEFNNTDEILEFINSRFNCNFKSIEFDNHNHWCDYYNVSPPKIMICVQQTLF